MKRAALLPLFLALTPAALPAQSQGIADYVAYWSFDEGSGEIAHDLSGNGFHGALLGARWAPGVAGGGVELDGFDDYLVVTDGQGYPDLIGDLEEGSVSVWFRIDRRSPASLLFPVFYLGDGIGGSGHSGLILEAGHGSVDSNVYFTTLEDDGRIPQCFDSIFDVEPGIWHHFVAVVGPESNTGYLDGVELTDRRYNWGEATDHFFFDDVRDKQVCWIGRGFYTSRPGDHYFDGAIDEIRVYDRALSGAEIAAYYQSVLAPEKEVVILSPRQGDTVRGVVPITGTAHGMSEVWISIDRGPLQPAQGAESWSFSWNTRPLADGLHTITAGARDSLGSPFVFDSIEVRVDNRPTAAGPPDRTPWRSDFTLRAGPLTAGATGRFTIARAAPNADAFLGYSLAGLGQTPLPSLGVVLDLALPSPAGTPLTTGPSGTAQWDLPIPTAAAGARLWLQAAQLGATSNVVVERVR